MEEGFTVNIKDVLMDMRKFRMGLIQTADQLQFSYLAILEGLQQLAEVNEPTILGEKNYKLLRSTFNWNVACFGDISGQETIHAWWEWEWWCGGYWWETRPSWENQLSLDISSSRRAL